MTKNTSVLLLLLGGLLLGGCATGSAHGLGAGAAGGFPEQTVDSFQWVQEASGLDEAARHPAGAALYPEQALRLLEQLAKTRVTPGNLVPRQTLCWLLGEVLAVEEHVDYAELRRRAGRFGPLVLIRPDGYAVSALSGRPLQRMGQVALDGGEWKVGRLIVGEFYYSREGVLYPVNDVLRRVDTPPWAELGLGRDPFNAALDGAQDAAEEMAVALGTSILHPIRTLEDLSQLPTSVARMVASSPEYFAHYEALSWEEQIREAARLSTHVMMLRGGAKATLGGMSGWGAELPVLSLSARGELVLGGVAVTGGTLTATLGVDLGALSVLAMAARGQGNVGRGIGTKAPAAAAQGPGRWVHKTPTTDSEQALNYQEQVIGQPAWRVYMIGEVEFDGFTGKELLEAKGASYENFLNKDGTIKPWFQSGKGFKALMDQAKKQSRLARLLNLPLIWHVAEARFAEFLRTLFAKEQLENIDIRHTPAAP